MVNSPCSLSTTLPPETGKLPYTLHGGFLKGKSLLSPILCKSGVWYKHKWTVIPQNSLEMSLETEEWNCEGNYTDTSIFLRCYNNTIMIICHFIIWNWLLYCCCLAWYCKDSNFKESFCNVAVIMLHHKSDTFLDMPLFLLLTKAYY